MLAYIILSLILAVAPLVLRSEKATNFVAALFFAVQVIAIAAILHLGLVDSVMLSIFRADSTAITFHVLMTAVLGFSLWHSSSYLKAEGISTSSYKAYYTLIMLLAVAITCHSSVRVQMSDYDVVGGNVVEAGNLITGAGAGVSVEFALAVVARLIDAETLARVKKGMEVA